MSEVGGWCTLRAMSKRRKIVHLWLTDFAADFTAIVAAYYAAVALRFHSTWGGRFFESIRELTRVGPLKEAELDLEVFYFSSTPRIIGLLTVTFCLLYALRGLYSGRRFIRPRPLGWNVLVANVIALFLFYAYFYMRRNALHPRSFFAMVVMLNTVFCVMFRSGMERLLRSLRDRLGEDRYDVLLLGSGEPADLLYGYLESVHPHGLTVAVRVPFDEKEPFGNVIERLRDKVQSHGVDMVILADSRLTINQIMQVFELSEELGVGVKVLSDKLNVVVERAKLEFDRIRGFPMVHFDAPRKKICLPVVRRWCAVAVACLAMLVALPVLGLIALLIKVGSRGPVLFVQERIGVDRHPFRMFKFRTMLTDAEQTQAEIEQLNESAGALFKMRKDPRVTGVGRFLRRFSLDELPQLFNVLKGDMTIVGPRPLPRRDFENYYEEWHYGRHAGLPGLTCLWQISGRSDLDFESMCILDVYYLRNRTWVLDLKILFRTVWVVLFARGAY